MGGRNKWQNKITRVGTANPEELLAHPGNFRRHPAHQKIAVGGSLAALGWVQQVIVNEKTNHIIDGHLRVEVAKQAGESAIPVVYVMLSEDEERMALLSLDPVGAMAVQDERKMLEVYEQVRDFADGISDYLADVLARHQTDYQVDGSVPDVNHIIDEQALAITTHECRECGFKW